jgi:hypothetical protein
MAKDDKKIDEIDTQEGITEINYFPNKISQTTGEIFARFHPYVMRGKPYAGKDSALIFTIRTNKEIKISVTDALGKNQVITIPENNPTKCSRIVFEQILLRWIQEGPADRIYEWNATGKIDLAQKNPFDLEVVKTETDLADPLSYCNDKDLQRVQRAGPSYEN